MRQVTIKRWAAVSAKGRRITPELTVWGAITGQGISRAVLAYSLDREKIEKMFPGAHNESTHRVDRGSGHCTEEECWRNPEVFAAQSF